MWLRELLMMLGTAGFYLYLVILVSNAGVDICSLPPPLLACSSPMIAVAEVIYWLISEDLL